PSWRARRLISHRAWHCLLCKLTHVPVTAPSHSRPLPLLSPPARPLAEPPVPAARRTAPHARPPGGLRARPPFRLLARALAEQERRRSLHSRDCGAHVRLSHPGPAIQTYRHGNLGKRFVVS